MDITSFPGELLGFMGGLGTRLQLVEWTAVPHIVLNTCSALLGRNTLVYTFVASLIPRIVPNFCCHKHKACSNLHCT